MDGNHPNDHPTARLSDELEYWHALLREDRFIPNPLADHRAKYFIDKYSQQGHDAGDEDPRAWNR